MSGPEQLEHDVAELSKKGLALSAVPVSTGRSYAPADYCEPVQVLSAIAHEILESSQDPDALSRSIYVRRLPSYIAKLLLCGQAMVLDMRAE
jgi:hypothetical protein